MAWTATENFNGTGYTNGASISGLNGGTGWSAGWVLDGGTVTAATAPAGGLNSLAWHTSDTSGSASTHRQLSTAVAAGTVRFEFNMSNVGNNKEVAIFLQDSANTAGAVNTNRMGLNINQSTGGHIYASNGQTYNTDLGSYSASSWITVDIKWDSAVANVFQVSINGGSFSSNNNSGGNITHIDTIRIFSDGANTAYDFYVDYIGPIPSGSSSASRLALLGVG